MGMEIRGPRNDLQSSKSVLSKRSSTVSHINNVKFSSHIKIFLKGGVNFSNILFNQYA